MPELPEVETVRRALVPAMQGRKITAAFVGRDDLRWPLPPDLADRITGRQVTGLDRRAKYILIRLSGDEVLLLHLGMSGSVRIHHTPPQLGKHDHVMVEMAPDATGQPAFVVFRDPRRFGWIDLFLANAESQHKLLAQLGPEPLGNEFSPAYLAACLKTRTGPIKTVLLNQQLVAGLGNIYVSEALFRAGISPRRRASSIRGVRADRLATAIIDTLRAAIADGGTSLRDHVQPGGDIGYFVQRLAVYGRAGEPCPTCAAPVQSLVQAGRRSFYCSHCQR